jgi:hypothetical protein
MSANSLVPNETAHPVTVTERHPVPSVNGNGYAPAAQIIGPASAYYGEGPPPPRAAVGPSLIETIFKLSLRRWKLLALWTVVAGAIAWFAAQKLARTTYSAQGTLIYMPADNWKRNEYFRPPEIPTVVEMLKSPDVLEQVRKELSIPVPSALFSKQVLIQPVKNTAFVTVTVEGTNGEILTPAANRLMELGVEKYSALRASRIEAGAKRAAEDRRLAIERRDQAEDDYRAALEKRDAVNIRVELEALMKEIVTIESDLDRLVARKNVCERQIPKLREQFAKKGKKGEPISEELLPPAQIQQIQLEELNLKLAQQSLEQNYRKLATNLELYRKGSLARADVELVQTEIRQLETQIKGYQERLKLLREVPLNPIGGAVDGDPVRLAYLKYVEMQNELDVLPDQIAATSATLGSKKARQKDLARVDAELRPLDREREKAEFEVQKVNQDFAVVNSLQASAPTPDATELRIWSKADEDSSPPATSNHMKLVVMVFGVGMLLFMGFVVAVDLPKTTRPAPKLPDLGVPVLAHMPRERPLPLAPGAPPPALSPSEDNHVQTLALGIGQGVTEPGSIILFTPLNDKVRIESVVAELARFYARDGGPVLLFDARAAHAKRLLARTVAPLRPAQVDAYLDGLSDDADECFAPTEVPCVEYTRGDLARRVNDGMMGMYRFRRLLDEMRQRYARVLMISPPLRETGDLDVLTALSETIVLVVPDHTSPNEVDPLVQSLRTAEAPIAGAVVIGESPAA